MPTKAEALAELARRGLYTDRSRMLSPVERKSIDDAQASSRNALDVVGDLTRFQDVNDRTATGGLNAIWGVTEARKALDPNVQQLEEIKSRLAPAQRQPGSGTTSDRDLALFLEAVPNVRNDRQTNTAIIERGRAEAVRRQQYADFLDKYARENGSLNGAQQAFRAYEGLGRRENPFTVKDAGDRSQLPRGAYYQSPEGLRRNDNGSRGNPLIEPARPMGPPKARSTSEQRPSLNDIFGE